MSDFFEKYWHEKFNDFSPDPSDNAWEKVNHELFAKQVKSLFSHYLIQPSQNVWRNILFSLWWKKFTAFSLYTFNIYYISSAIVAALVVTSQYKPFSPKPPALSNSSTSEQATINTQRDISPILHQNQINRLTVQTSLSTNQSQPVILKKIINNQPTVIEKNNFIAEIERPEPINSLFAKNCDSLKNLFSDEQYPSFTNKEISLLFTHRSIDLYLAPVFSSAAFSLKPNSGDEFYKNYSSNHVSTSLDYSASLMYEWQKYNYSVSVGFSLSKVTQRFNYIQAQFMNDTIHSQQIIDNSYFHYSHVDILNLDSLLLTGDTVWIHHIDSALVMQIDTVHSSQVVHHRNNTKQHSKFSFTTIELPVLAGYSYTTGRLDFSVKGGVSLAYVAVSVGTIASPYDDYGTVPVTRKTFSMFYMNAIGGIEATYHVSSKISVSMMPFYKHSITPVFSKMTPLNVNIHSFLLNVGLKYNLK
jgi:hypothetical protein